MGFCLYLLFYGCLKLRFLDVEENPGPRPRNSCRVMFTNINGLHGNLDELAVASSSGFDVVVCAEAKVTGRRHAAELKLPGFVSPSLLLRGARPNGMSMALYVKEGFQAARRPQYECTCCEFMVVRIAGKRLNMYMFFVYRSPSTDDRVYECLLEAMGKVQSADKKSVFCFVGDFNCHNTEWLGSAHTDSHGRAAQDFATMTDCAQLVRESTHRLGGILDLVMCNVPDLCQTFVGGCIGRSDHCHLKVVLDMSTSSPGFDFAQHVPLKSRANWNGVRAELSALNWGAICRSHVMIDDLDSELQRVLSMHVPMTVVRKRVGDAPWFTADCRRAFESKQTAYHRWCRSRDRQDFELFLQERQLAEHCYAAAKRQFASQCREKLSSCASSHAWWSTLKESVFGKDSSIPALQSAGGALVSDPTGKAELLSAWFDSKQSRESIVLPASCPNAPMFKGIAFRSRELEELLGALDSYGGVDPTGLFPLFFKESASVLAPGLSRVFRRLLRLGQFPGQWRVADITPIPKGPISALVSGYRPISITPILSKVFERLVASRFGKFMERQGLFPSHQYSYRKGLGTCDALLDLITSGQAALDTGGELALVQIDFSAAFDRVNHRGLIFKLRNAGVAGPMLKVFHDFLMGRTQRVKVDGAYSSSVAVLSGVPQGSVLGPLLFLLYVRDLQQDLENVLLGYADDSTLMAHVPSSRDRPSISASLNRDLERISSWCKLWGMQINPRKTKGMIISRSRTRVPLFSDLVLDGVVVEMVDVLKILGVSVDSRLTFEAQLRDVTVSAARKLGILRKAMSVFRDTSLVERCFWSFLLPVLEYCSPVWMSAAASHLRLLDRVVRVASRMSGGRIVCDLWHRRRVASLCVFYRIRGNAGHPVNALMPPVRVAPRLTRGALAAHSHTLEVPWARTVQFSRSFIPAVACCWNMLDESCFAGDGLAFFKSSVNRVLRTRFG